MDSDLRLAELEQKVETWQMLDARLKAIEDSLKKMSPKSSVRDWIQTLSPFAIAITVFAIGFVFKDSVVQALEREKVDLSYVGNVRDLIKNFDTSQDQSSADSNAIALAMYGKFSLVPLIERLQGGDVAQLAAERGLRIVGSIDPAAACSAFTKILLDPARQYPWQTHNAVVRLMGASDCVPGIPVLDAYLADMGALANPAKLQKFARRYSNSTAFDAENVDPFRQEVRDASSILNVSRDRADHGEKAWWK
jgi:hypothetical protein